MCKCISLHAQIWSYDTIEKVLHNIHHRSINHSCPLTLKRWNITYTIIFISNILLQAAPKITLPANLKEPVEVENGEDLVLRVPYSGQPTPKVHSHNS